MTDNIAHDHHALRSKLKARRDALDPTDRNRGALLIRGRLFTWLATRRESLEQAGRPTPRHIAAFWSLSAEPALQPLLRQWVEEDDLEISLPVMAAEPGPLTFHLWTPDTPLRTARHGIQEPDGSPTAPPPDIVLVPTLGYTRQGDRIGYGQGYYDRTLATLRQAGHSFLAVGIAWATGDLSGEPYQPAAHDQRLDAILTDKGWALPAPAV